MFFHFQSPARPSLPSFGSFAFTDSPSTDQALDLPIPPTMAPDEVLTHCAGLPTFDTQWTGGYRRNGILGCSVSLACIARRDFASCIKIELYTTELYTQGRIEFLKTSNSQPPYHECSVKTVKLRAEGKLLQCGKKPPHDQPTNPTFAKSEDNQLRGPTAEL